MSGDYAGACAPFFLSGGIKAVNRSGSYIVVHIGNQNIFCNRVDRDAVWHDYISVGAISDEVIGNFCATINIDFSIRDVVGISQIVP